VIVLRPYRPDDAPHLLALFRDTIRRINCRDYDPEQIRAWASNDIDPAEWAARFEGRFVVVAELSDEHVGFAELEPNGHIDRFYVSADFQRCWVGRMMLRALCDEAQSQRITRLFTEASITARPFFEAHGFRVITPQTVTLRGVKFLNFKMERAESI
jgi:putative acetyltransferase